MNSATYRLATDRLIAEFDNRLSDDDYQAITAAGFAWWPQQKAFAAKWTPEREDLLTQRFGLDVEFDDDPDNAEGRIEKYLDHSHNALARAQNHHQRAKDISDRIPLGQPILRGHHSYSSAMADRKRIEGAWTRFSEEYEKAQYWENRAHSAARRAAKREQPGTIYRRIERLETDLRKMERRLKKYPEYQQHTQRWIDHINLQLAYERELYQQSGGIAADSQKLKPGDLVNWRNHWCTVEKVNKKTVKVKVKDDWTLKLSIADITEVQHN